MARYKPYNLKQDKWIPLSYAHQIVPGSFEYAPNEIVEAKAAEKPRPMLRQAQHERIPSPISLEFSAYPEPFDFAQDRLVEG